MKRKLNSILLVDDNPEDNYFNQIIIDEMNIVNNIDVVVKGIEAIAYLKIGNHIQLNIHIFRLEYAKNER